MSDSTIQDKFFFKKKKFKISDDIGVMDLVMDRTSFTNCVITPYLLTYLLTTSFTVQLNPFVNICGRITNFSRKPIVNLYHDHQTTSHEIRIDVPKLDI